MDNLYSSVSRGGCYNTNHYTPRPVPLFKHNYLNEFGSEAEKELVRLHLGIKYGNENDIRNAFVKENLFRDQIPGHKDVETLYQALVKLFEGLNIDNEKLEDLEEKSKIIAKLLGIVPSKIPELLGGNGKEYDFPKSVNEIKGGYLKELLSLISNNEESIDNLINVIGTYSTTKVDANGKPIVYNKYGGNNSNNKVYSVKEAIDDLDERIINASSIFAGADELGNQLKIYKDLLDQDAKILTELLEEISNSKTEVSLDLTNAQKNILDTVDNLILDIQSKMDSLNAEIGLYSDPNAGIEASGLRKELEELSEKAISDLRIEIQNIIGALGNEEIESTGVYKTLDDYIKTASSNIDTLAANAIEAASAADKLINGDMSSDDPEKQKPLSQKILEALALVSLAENIIKNTGLDNYYTKSEVDTIITDVNNGISDVNTNLSELQELVNSSILIQEFDASGNQIGNNLTALKIKIVSSMPIEGEIDNNTFYFIKES